MRTGANVVIHHLTSTQDAAAAGRGTQCGPRRTRRSRCRRTCWISARLPELVAAAVRDFGRLDILINNASTFYRDADRRDHAAASSRI